MDYYRILGLEKNATQDDIKKAYRNLAKKYHPDINEDKNAEYLFMQIKQAYETLIDQNKRCEYDYKMGFTSKDNSNGQEEAKTVDEQPQEETQEEPQSEKNKDRHYEKWKSAASPIRIKTNYAIIAVVAIAAIAVLILANMPRQVTAVRLNHDNLQVEVGDDITNLLVATVLPTNATKMELVWETNNDNVVQMQYVGRKLVASNEGTAIITAKDRYTGHQAQCRVTVTLKFVTNHDIYSPTPGVYSGTIKDYKPHGIGIMEYQYGGRYEGGWQDGNRHGQGTQTEPTWSKFQGNWVNGNLHGPVEINSPDGVKLLFQYTHGEPSDKGVAILPDGRSREAFYKDGRFAWPK